jgi:hypothetical protein
MAPERAAATVALLGPTAAARVRLAVLAEHGVAPVRSVVGLRSAAASPRPADLDVRPPSARSPRPVLAVPPRAATGPDPVDPAVARLHPEARALLETALLLEAPVIPTVPGPEEAAAAERASSYEPDAAPALHVVPPSAEPTRPAAASAPAPVVLAAATDEDPERPRPPGEVVPLHPRSPGPGRRAPLPGPGSGPGSDDGDPPPWQHHPWQASGPAVPTALASLLYAVNLMPLLDRTPPRPGSGWAVVEALGRWLLRDLPPARRRELLRDPLLPLLATLDGREPDVPSPVRLGAATRPVRAFLDKHRIGAEAFVQPGRVLVSRTHVDVLLLLDHADPRVRVTGLDQDPGWVAALGRIVLFHFEDQP